MQGFSGVLIARDKRVCQIGEPSEDSDEGEFSSIFGGKECFSLRHASAKEGGDEEERDCFFRFHRCISALTKGEVSVQRTRAGMPSPASIASIWALANRSPVSA